MSDRPELRTPTAEQLLLNACSDIEAQRVLSSSLGRAQAAAAVAVAHPESQVICHFLDQYQASEARQFQEGVASNLEFICSADYPAGEFDLFMLPVTRGGEAELTRDLLQTGYDRLRPGGWLCTAVDNWKDTWLHHEVEKLGKGLVRRPKPRGIVYRLQKRERLKRRRDLSCEFVFRDGPNLVQAFSRPGVFSHRQLDLGARALLEGMQVAPGMQILEIGCGSGVVSLAAALREADVQITAIDSNARAVECTRQGAVLNNLTDRVAARLDADGSTVAPAAYDLVVGNPPYFSQYKIADIFLHTARKALRRGGQVAMVTKRPEWFEARMQQLFKGEPQIVEHRGYFIVSTTR